MRELLSPHEERLIETFASNLAVVDTLDQMFPPDDAGDSEQRMPLHPCAPTCEQICLAAVHDIKDARHRAANRLKVVGGGILESATT